jgi:tellurite resistance protein TerB
MGFMDFVNDAKQKTVSSIGKFKNKDFLEAVVAGCAMVAAADGNIDSSEKSKMVGFINRNEALKIFDMGQVISRFTYYAEGYAFDFNVGKAECLKAISKVKKNPEEARILVSVCCAIGSADGDFDEDEKRVIREMCRELGLDPKDFQL